MKATIRAPGGGKPRWPAALALLAPAVVGVVWLAALFAPILSPDRALANRDIATFHLPLRASFRELATAGVPWWSPWLHSGQPVLSNPSYSAFYPPSWLVFVAPPHYALSLLVVLHAALAFVGAWRLARRLGGERATAALAGIAFVGCGGYLSLLSALNLYMGLSWLPWVLLWGDEALRAARGARWLGPALLSGCALGMALLNGEPSTVVMSGLGLLALAVSAAHDRRDWHQTSLRVLVPVAFALALAAVQLLPTLGRLADSPRKDLPAEYATTWSLPPARVVEMVFPRFFGDPSHSLEGRFFGWQLNDQDHPYLESLYPGLLLAVVGLVSLLRPGIPRRSAWFLSLAGALLLALGRHDPLDGWVRLVPIFGMQRFPERFAALAVLALVFAGVLGWQRLLADRDARRPESTTLPLVFSALVLAGALTMAVSLALAPHAADRFVAALGDPELDAAGRADAAAYLGREAWAAVITAAAVTGLLGLCRWRRPPRRLLATLAPLLVAADLWHYGQGLLLTTPADTYRVPPPLAAALQPASGRTWVQETLAVDKRWGDPSTLLTRSQLSRLVPYAGVIWHLPYAFHADFDLMLTGWARRAAATLAGLQQPTPTSPVALRYLGAWHVGTLLMLRTDPAQPPAADDPAAAFLVKVENPEVLPRYRFVPRVSFHPTLDAAVGAAAASGWLLAREEHVVRPGESEAANYARPPELLEVDDAGSSSHLHLRYRSEAGAFFVAAMTFDAGWRARVDGERVPALPTAACQLAVELPAGEHRLDLDYWDPLVPIGAAITMIAVVGLLTFRVSGAPGPSRTAPTSDRSSGRREVPAGEVAALEAV